MTEALKQALMTLDGIADTNPRNKDDFDSPAAWITWAKSRAQFEAGRIRTALTQATASEGEPVAWRWMPSQEFPMWVYSDDKARVMEALRFMGHGGVQPLYTAQPAPAARPMPEDELLRLFDLYAKQKLVNANAAATVTRDKFRALLRIGSQPTAHAVPAEQEAHGWCAYVGGMVAHWIKSEPDAHARLGDDKFEAAIAGIIERRMWALKREPVPVELPPAHASEWLLAVSTAKPVPHTGIVPVKASTILAVNAKLSAAPAAVPAVPEVSEGWRTLPDIVRSIRQTIEHGYQDEQRKVIENPSIGTGLHTYLWHRMDEISALLASAPTSTTPAASEGPKP
jgi:hypothetical protein